MTPQQITEAEQAAQRAALAALSNNSFMSNQMAAFLAAQQHHPLHSQAGFDVNKFPFPPQLLPPHLQGQLPPFPLMPASQGQPGVNPQSMSSSSSSNSNIDQLNPFLVNSKANSSNPLMMPPSMLNSMEQQKSLLKMMVIILSYF